MSLLLEFRTPQNPEATSAGTGTNWFFPTTTCLRMQLTAKVERLRGPMGKPRRTPNPPVTQANYRPLGFVISRSRAPTSELPVNDLLTNPGNSD
jgi:hypothetical protein